MESLSTAASVIGIISISFEYSRISISYDSLKPRSESFGHLAQLRPTITKVRNSLSNLTSSMEKLCDILQMIKIKPRNVMQPLPVQEELAFDQCASDLIKLESLVRRISQETVHTGNPLMNSMRGYPMVLRDGHVEEMQDILETHIKALEPLARMPSIVSQPTGSEHLTTVSKRLMDEICSANFIHYSDLTTSNSVRLRDNEGRKALASDRQDDFPSRVKNAMQRLHTEDITFSRLQLYSLLCLLIEINGPQKDDEEITDDQEENVSQEDTEYKAFKRQSHICLRQLANLAKTKLTRSRPSPEARNIILTLKEFIWEVEIRSDPQNNNSISLVGKRKVEAGSMSEIARDGNDLHKFKRARRMNVGYQWPSMTTRKSPREVQLCGRLANEDS